MAGNLTLLEFVEEHIATTPEFRKYQALANVDLTHSLYAIFNFDEALANASPEIREKYELERLFAERIRHEMAHGSWVVTARWSNGGPFKELNRREWERGNIDILNNRMGDMLGGKLVNGYRNIAIAPDQNSLVRWRSQEGLRDVDAAVKHWLADYTKKDGEPITCFSAHKQCQIDLSPRIPKNAISEARFRKLFAKYLPQEFKHKGRPTGNKLAD